LKNLKEVAEDINPFVSSYTSEFVQIGGELTGIQSLKIIARRFLEVTIKPSPDTGKIVRIWNFISRNQFIGEITWVEPTSITVGHRQEIEIGGFISEMV
jgi:hypothetical protein